jgi:hypothetical protein
MAFHYAVYASMELLASTNPAKVFPVTRTIGEWDAIALAMIKFFKHRSDPTISQLKALYLIFCFYEFLKS